MKIPTTPFLVVGVLALIGYAVDLHHADAPKQISKLQLCPVGQHPLWVDSGRDENGVLQFVYVCDKGDK